MTFTTDRVALLAKKPLLHYVVLKAAATFRDYMVIGVLKMPRGMYWAEIFHSSRSRAFWASLIQPADETWEWSLYAIEDSDHFHSPCRE